MGIEDGVDNRVMESTEFGYNVGQLTYPLEQGQLTITVKGHSGMVLIQEREWAK